MSYFITLSPGDLVYVRHFGYGVLTSCGEHKKICQKVKGVIITRKDSFIFDPEMFNENPDQKKQIDLEIPEQEEIPLKMVNTVSKENEKLQLKNKPSRKSSKLSQKREISQKQQTQQSINIVTVKLEPTQALIYTNQKNITKVLSLPINVVMSTMKEKITIQIEITKTLDSLKKQIFAELKETYTNYYNIKLYATYPFLNELTVNSKTLIQSQIRQNSPLILMAQYSFTFKSIANLNANSKTVQFNLSGNNLILTSNFVIQEGKTAQKTDKKQQIKKQEPKKQTKKQQTNNNVYITPLRKDKSNSQHSQKSQFTPTKNSIKVPQKQVKDRIKTTEWQKFKPQIYHIQCNVEFQKGINYWEFKITTVPKQPELLYVGVCLPQIGCNSISYKFSTLWGFYPFAEIKIMESQETASTQETIRKKYGKIFVANDVLGVLLVFVTQKLAILRFYQNKASLGDCDQIQLKDNTGLIPFVNTGGESSITLDSRPQLPLDAYRQK